MESYVVDVLKPTRTAKFTGKRTGPTSISPFQFANIVVTDDFDQSNNEEAFVKNIASIEVSVHRCTLAGQPQASTGHQQYDNPHKTTAVHERTKKGLMSHVTSLGAAVYTPPVNTVSVDWVDQISSPLFTFRFNYRSRGEIFIFVDGELLSNE